MTLYVTTAWVMTCIVSLQNSTGGGGSVTAQSGRGDEGRGEEMCPCNRTQGAGGDSVAAQPGKGDEGRGEDGVSPGNRAQQWCIRVYQ